jgi:Putative beta-barrel porin 2
MSRNLLRSAVILLIFAVCPAAAQDSRRPDPKAEPWRDARLRLGPIFFNPTFRIRDLGRDDNVFNDVEGAERRDLTGTLAMTSLAGLQARSFLFTAEQSNSYTWYRTYTSERSVDGSLNLIGQLRLGVIRPWVGWERAETHERGGFEIDARAGRETPSWQVGSDLQLGWRLGVTGIYRKSELKYAEGEVFDGVDLGSVLDRKSESMTGYGRLELTDWTSAVGGVEYNRLRYDQAVIRDSDDIYYFGGIESSAESKLGLNLRVGWFEQRHTDPTVVGFEGIVASGSTTFIVKDFMQLMLSADRQIGQSYEEIYPYFLEQGGEARTTIRFSEHFDLRFDAKTKWLRYRETFSGVDQPRLDRSMVLGGEFGYFFGGASGTRVGIRYEYAQRTSPVALKNYARSRVYSDFRLSF